VPVLVNCTVCKKDYKVRPYQVNNTKFCSIECKNHTQYTRRDYRCAGCGKEAQTSGSRPRKKYCSMECKSIGAQNIKERRAKQKQSAIKKRGFIKGRDLKKQLKLIRNLYCDVCNYKEYDFCLDVHHLDHNPLNNEISNLAVLCCICHRKLHKNIIEYKRNF
jgi:endogenous inhibitor of DNA gyrase (YacG/DUF329 family)